MLLGRAKTSSHLEDLDADLLVEVLCPVQDLGQALAGVQQRDAATCEPGYYVGNFMSHSKHALQESRPAESPLLLGPKSRA